MANNKGKRAVIYGRVSTDGQTTDNQIIALNSPLLKYRSDQAGSSATAITMMANPS